MDKRDCQKIDLAYDTIAHLVDMNILWPQLLENNIFSTDDIDIPSTWLGNLDEYETKKNIISSIKTRGADAFKNFVLSLEQSNYKDLAKNLNELETDLNDSQDEIASNLNEILEINSVENDFEMEENNNGEPSTSTANKKRETLKTESNKSLSFQDTCLNGETSIKKYSMSGKYRGKVLIVGITKYSNPENGRKDIKVNVINLKQFFEARGFEVIVSPDYLEVKDLKRIVRDFARENFKNVDSCFVVISSHGNRAKGNANAKIITSDYDSINCSKIIDFFTAENCEDLRGKPKIFIFDMCRGSNFQSTVPSLETNGKKFVEPFNEEQKEKMKQKDPVHRNYEDMLIVHSTISDYVSYNIKDKGSLFLHAVYKVFMNEAYDKHVSDLFTRVDDVMKEWKVEGIPVCQTIDIINKGFKHCYLNPGYFEENN